MLGKAKLVRIEKENTTIIDHSGSARERAGSTESALWLKVWVAQEPAPSNYGAQWQAFTGVRKFSDLLFLRSELPSTPGFDHTVDSLIATLSRSLMSQVI